MDETRSELREVRADCDSIRGERAAAEAASQESTRQAEILGGELETAKSQATEAEAALA